MSKVECYIPEYVVQLEKESASCGCEFCLQEAKTPVLVDEIWADEIRRSSDIRCKTACMSMLFNPEAFILHQDVQASDSNVVLSTWFKTLNQLCINLVVQPTMTMEQRLYAIGVLLSKAQKLTGTVEDEAELIELTEQLIGLAEEGALQAQFQALPQVDRFPLQAMRKLGSLPLVFEVDPLQSMQMTLKQNELVVMSEAFLEVSLSEIRQCWTESVAPFLSQHPYVLQNYVLHRLYHDVFPHSETLGLEQMYLLLLQDYYHLRLLCCLWIQCGEAMDTESMCQLVSAYTRWRVLPGSTALMLEDSAEESLLLQGLALLVE